MNKYRIVELKNGTYRLQRGTGNFLKRDWVDLWNCHCKVINDNTLSYDGNFGIWHSLENALSEMKGRIKEENKELEKEQGLKIKKIHFKN